jgi:Ca2+-binding EF-hand superfamily protein
MPGGLQEQRARRAPWPLPRSSLTRRSSEGTESSRRSLKRTRLRRRDSRPDLGRRRGSTESDLAADFVLEGQDFFGDAKKRALKVFRIGSLRGVEAYRVWRRVFEALKVDGEVHHADLGRALERAGFQNADQECIDAAKQKATQWSTWSGLNKAQFNEFAMHFGTECEKLEEKMFAVFDVDCSGRIDRDELEGVLKHFGVIPMRHILDDVMREVDEDLSGNIDLDEFRKALEILRLRGGFSREEFQNLTDLFKMFDIDGSGNMDKREVALLLGYLDYRLSADERDRILQEVDTNGSGELSQFGFLFFMLKCRQIEMGKLADVFSDVDPEAKGLISFGQLLRAFTKLGYEPDPCATREAATALGISSTEASLDISDFWRVLTECRAREWFSNAELRQISEAFEKADACGSGEIGVAHIDKALLAMGLSLRTELLLYLVSKVDLDCSGLVNQVEFRKLIRIYQIGRTQLMRATFQAFLDQGSFVLSFLDSWKAFYTLGLVTKGSKKDATRVRAMGSLDSKAFLREARSLQREQQLFRQKNSGFSEQDVDDLAMRFRQFDLDHSGALQGRELVVLIDNLLPGVANALENRPMLMKMLEEAQGRSGTITESDKLVHRQVELNFPQFLKLLSLVRVFKVDQLVQREEQVIEECNLRIHEVQQFRELFLENASLPDCMTMKDLWRLFGNIVPLRTGGQRNEAALQKHIRAVVGATPKLIRDDTTLTCAELMMLVRRLREANFGGIRDKFFS